VLATVWRVNLSIFQSVNDLGENVRVVAILIVGTWLFLLSVTGAYKPAFFGAGTDEYRSVVNASIGTAALVGIACYLANFPLSRGFYVLLFALGVPALLVSRLVVRRIVQRARMRGHLVQEVLVVGSAGHVDDVASVLTRESWLGYSVLGCLTPTGMQKETKRGIPVLGRVEQLAEFVDKLTPDVVFFGNGAFRTAEQMRHAAWELEEHARLQIVVAPSLTEVSSERIQIRPVAGLPLVFLEQPRWRHAASWAKRTFDIIVSSLLLLLVSPLWLALSVWIKFQDRGPILFSQVRVGRDGKLFRCLKFRSMVCNAENLVTEIPQDDADHVLFKSRQDPRVTTPGRWMRRFSVDELPQLWNVLQGHMSLVGPRPPLPSEVEQYHTAMHRRLNVRPGMTGLWQVSGRSDLSWEDTVRLDLYYVDNWSMVQDLSILVRTVRAVATGRGAY
jgi:exopolysaccharide biosynthesis polyprenyl glycosylphosphotransferase